MRALNWYFAAVILVGCCILILTRCAPKSDQEPNAVAAVQNCYGGGYGSQTCRVTFKDGQTGFTVQQYNGPSYFCKGSGL